MAHDPEKGKELGQIILNSEPKVKKHNLKTNIIFFI